MTKTRIFSALTPLATVILAGGLIACSESAQPPAATASSLSSEPVLLTAPEEQVLDKAQWSCPSNGGTAPKGRLIAERVDAADSTRDEPGLYEGPVWLNGALYFSDFTFADGFPSRIQRLVDDSTMDTVVEDSGSNGLAVDADGFIIGALHSTKSLTRFNLTTGERSNIAGIYQENAFNSPNDLTEAKDGSVYFTDPDFQRAAAPGGQDKTRVYRVGANGEVTVVDDTIANPNGIALSPNQDVLYVAGGGEGGFLRAYPIVDGVPGEGKNLVDNVRVPDGLAIDCLGNIYVTEHLAQQARVFSPAGEELATIKVDANITNAAFGGPDRKTLYLTGAGSVWKLELDVAGFPY